MDTEAATSGKIRVAVVQLAYHPAFTHDGRRLIEEPFGDGSKDLPTLPLTEAEFKGELSALQQRIRAAYVQQLAAKLQDILRWCRSRSVQLVVFPEYSIPFDLLAVITEHADDLIVVAGSHYVDREALESGVYEQLGATKPVHRCALSLVLHRQRAIGQTSKLHPSPKGGEAQALEGGNNWSAIPLPNGLPSPLGVRICIDFIDTEHPSVHAVIPRGADVALWAVPSLSRATRPFWNEGETQATRHKRPVLYANRGEYGRSAIFVDNSAIDPLLPRELAAGEEGVLVVDLDLRTRKPGGSTGFGERPFVDTVAAASLVYRSHANDAQYASWLEELSTLRELEGTVLERLRAAAAHANTVSSVLDRRGPTTRYHRLSRLVSTAESLETLEEFEKLTSEVVLEPLVLRLGDLEAALATATERVLRAWNDAQKEPSNEVASAAQAFAQHAARGRNKLSLSPVGKATFDAIVTAVAGAANPADAVESLHARLAFHEIRFERDQSGRYDTAIAELRKGHYDKALEAADAALGELENLPSPIVDGPTRTSRWRLLKTVALLNLQDMDAVEAELARIDVGTLGPADLLQLAELNAEVGSLDTAATLLEQVRLASRTLEPASQSQLTDVAVLLQLCEGEIPDDLPRDPGIRLKAAQVALAQGDLSRADVLARAALQLEKEPVLYRAIAILVLMRIVADTVFGRTDAEPISPTELEVVIDAIEERLPAIEQEVCTLSQQFREQFDSAQYGYLEAVYDVDGRERLERQGRVPSNDPGVEEALGLARRGELRAAVESLPRKANAAVWVHQLDAARLALESGDRQRFREDLESLVRQHPHAAPIQFALALAYLRDGETPQALEHARTAHSLVPAVSYRAVLAQCLADQGRSSEAWSLLSRDHVSTRPRIVVHLAELAEKCQPDQASGLWQRYAKLTGRREALVQEALALALAGHRVEAAARAWDVFERYANELEPQWLYKCAKLQDFAESQLDRINRIRRISRTIEERFPNDPGAQQARLELHLELGDAAEGPFDKYALLEQAGVLQRFESSEMLGDLIELAKASAAREDELWNFYASGGISLEGLARALGTRVVRVVEAIWSGRRHVCAPITFVAPPLASLSDCELLLTEPELLLLGYLGVLPALAGVANERSVEIVISNDTRDSLQGAALEQFPKSNGEERAVRDASDFILLGFRQGWIRCLDWPEFHAGLAEPIPQVPASRDPDLDAILRAPLSATLRVAGGVLASDRRWRASLDHFGYWGIHHHDLIRQLAWASPLEHRKATLFLLRARSRTLTVPQLVRLLWEKSTSTEFRRLETAKRLALQGFPDAVDGAQLLALARKTSEPTEAALRNVLDGLERASAPSAPLGGFPVRNLICETYSIALLGAYVGTLSEHRVDSMLDGHQETISGERLSEANGSSGELSAVNARMLAEALLGRAERNSGAAGTMLQALLSQVATRALRHLRQAVVRDESAGGYEISPMSPAGRLWSDLRDWAGSDGSRRQALYRALRDAWCIVDALSGPEGPTRAEQGPLILAQRLSSEPPTDSAPPHRDIPQLDQRETEAILSWYWTDRPLSHDGLWVGSPGADGVQKSWESILEQAALDLVTSMQGAWLPFDERRFGYDLRLGKEELGLTARGTVFVPVEAVLLRTGAHGIQKVIPYLKYLQGRHDGHAFHMLEELASKPEDREIRSRYARYTATALWRLVREDPAYLLRWPERIPVVDDELRPSFKSLCRILHEPPGVVGDQTQAQWLDDRLERLVQLHDKDGPTDRALITDLMLLETEVPGAAPGAILTLLENTPAFAEQALERLSDPDSHSAAALARDVMLLRRLSVRQPVLQLQGGPTDLREVLPEKLERLVLSILADPREHDAAIDDGPALRRARDRGLMAQYEATILRACGSVLWTLLAGRADRRQADWLWLTYRLHAWLTRQLASLDADGRRHGIERLAKAAPVSWGADDPRAQTFADLLNPFLFLARGIDYRQTVILFALDVSADLVRGGLQQQASEVTSDVGGTDTAQTEATAVLSNPALERHLLEIAEEASVAAPNETTWFDWPAPRRAPDLAFRALFKMNPESVLKLKESALLGRIERIPLSAASAHASDWELAEILVHLLSDGAARLTPQVRAALERRLKNLGTQPEEERLRWIGLTALFSTGATHLQKDAAELLESRLDAPEVELALSQYLAGVSGNDAARLEAEVQRLIKTWDNRRARGLKVLSLALARLVVESGDPLRGAAARLLVEIVGSAELGQDAESQALIAYLRLPPAGDE